MGKKKKVSGHSLMVVCKIGKHYACNDLALTTIATKVGTRENQLGSRDPYLLVLHADLKLPEVSISHHYLSILYTTKLKSLTGSARYGFNRNTHEFAVIENIPHDVFFRMLRFE